MKSDGYTLLEMVIVIAIVGILVPSVFSVLSVILKQEIEVYKLVETKRQGDYVLSYFKDKVRREAVEIRDGNSPGSPVCHLSGLSHASANDGKDFYFFINDTDYFRVYADNGIMYIDGTGIPTTSLHTDKVEVSNISLECHKNSQDAPTVISFTFDTEYIQNVPVDVVNLSYKTRLRLRNQ